MRSSDDGLPDLLRQALHAEADRQVPAGDGLQRIRERVNARRHRLAWLRPSLAAVAAAGVVVAVTVVPTVLRGVGQQPSSSSQQTGSQPGTAAEPALPSPNQLLPTQGRTASPKTTLYDMRTVWPYASRAEGTSRADGDVARGVHPELTNAVSAAVTFVQSYVGHQTALSATSNGRLGSGIGVSVYRALPGGSRHLVSLVYLVRVRDADDSPYVVAAASRSATADDPTTLAVFPPAETLPLRSGPIAVSGNSRRPGQTAAPRVRVEIRDETATQDLTVNQADLVPDPAATDLFSWATTLSLVGDDVSKANTIAAWTSDDTGAVLEFVATPVPLGTPTAGGG